MRVTMQGVVNRGKAVSLRTVYNFQGDVAGKTGTSQNLADGWFIGFTPEIIAGAWVGAATPKIHFRNLNQGQGAATALSIWANFMNKVYRDENLTEFNKIKFNPVDSSLLENMKCDDFIEEPAFLDKIIPGNNPFIKMLKNLFRSKMDVDSAGKNRNN